MTSYAHAVTADHELQSRRLIGAWYGIAVLVAATVLATVNDIIILLTTDSIKASLGLSDTQIGLLSGFAITLMAAVGTYPMGWLADRVDRRILMAICIAIWSAATIGFGLSQSFSALIAWAVLMSISEAVLAPMSYSVIPDLFPREKWVIANYVLFVCALVGLSLGLSLSGALIGYVDAVKPSLPFGLDAMESWRAALILSTVTGPVLMVAVLFIPLRRRVIDRVAASTAGLADFIRNNARSLVGVFFGFGVAYAALGTLRRWLAPALTREFGETPAEVGRILGQTTLVAALGGVALGWLLVRLLKPKLGEETLMRVAQLGIIGGLVAACALPFSNNAAQLYAISAFAFAFIMMAMSLSPTILQVLAPAQMRGRVIALGGLVTLAFGAISPIIVGIFSDRVFSGENALLWSMVAVSVPALVVGLLFMLYGTGTLRETIDDAARRS